MEANIHLDDELLKDAKEFSGISEDSAVVNEALKVFTQVQAARSLAKLGGTQPDLESISRRRSS